MAFLGIPARHFRRVSRRRRPGVSMAGVWLVAALYLAATSPAIPVQRDGLSEYHLKAAFLVNFTRFVEWPEDRFPGPEAPILIGILGDDPFGELLPEMVNDKTIDGREIEISYHATAETVSRCHLLYVSSSERPRLDCIMKALDLHGLLTVGDTDGFISRGGTIRLKLEGKHVRFEINLAAAEAAGLKISSKLLNLAEVVE
ncbi:MAG: DUF4154 domain-containing protein [Candidatus Eisenbacteria bacterium]|nr:DUF4154 domain-containing protein [Candidatus Eisenbacteria bacterium]